MTYSSACIVHPNNQVKPNWYTEGTCTIAQQNQKLAHIASHTCNYIDANFMCIKTVRKVQGTLIQSSHEQASNLFAWLATYPAGNKKNLIITSCILLWVFIRTRTTCKFKFPLFYMVADRGREEAERASLFITNKMTLLMYMYTWKIFTWKTADCPARQ